MNLWAAYGFYQDSGISIVDPASGEQLDDLTIEEVLTLVSVVIDRTGLSLDELEQALRTPFVSGYWAGIDIIQRDQCKTSQMHIPAEGSVLEVILDRLHRFTRLLRKLPDWSIAQLNKAIASCGGLENSETELVNRENVLVNLAIIKRLHENQGIPLATLLDMPVSVNNLRKSLGMSENDFSLLKVIAPIDLTNYGSDYPFDWASLDIFIHAAKRIRESRLTINQVAEAMLTRDHLIALFGELPPSIKTDTQIETLLREIQDSLRDVVVTRQDVTLEAQAAEALTAIFNEAIAAKLVNAIRDAGSTDASVGTPDTVLVDILSAGSTHKLGEWLPLLSNIQTLKILTVVATNNPDANTRFEQLLDGIAARRRERALITVIAEQCGLTEVEVSSLLGTRLLLAPSTLGQDPVVASNAFLDKSFWADVPLSKPPAPPGVTINDFPLLHAWMDRLYRLVVLSAALKLDSELMFIADRVVVGPRVGSTDAPRDGIDWRELLTSTPVSMSAWFNPNLQALMDMVWLQLPEQVSRPVLNELLDRLPVNGPTTVLVKAVRPLATRMEMAEAQTLVIAGQAISSLTRQNFCDPVQLRHAFELLLLARHLGADGVQLDQLANSAGNAQAASTAKTLLQAKIGEEEWPAVLQRIDDLLRQQRRDALVAYLIHNNDDELSNVNDLYEYYLIDPQMEPCFETTWILEAITATQLFAQRILFGIEQGISASTDLRNRWTWMRNYRVWEANRKVFLFPENWMFPELRDDKSSSFKQLESALGQGELTQDLARQSFGQFLDDVAQMGQVEVLGMYEDIAYGGNGALIRRTLYIISRTLNPPYAYFWRQCVDFGSFHMEWSPWQRIELDIQGDHVLPFVLGGELHIAWPLIRSITSAAKDEWEVKLAWSRYDGKSWRKSSASRDFWREKAADFSDERRGFALRCETELDSKAKIFIYAITDASEEKADEDSSRPSGELWDDETHPGTAANKDDAFHFLSSLILDSYRVSKEGQLNIEPVIFVVDVYPTPCGEDRKLPSDIKRQLFLYCYIKNNWERKDDLWRHLASDGLLNRSYTGGRTILFANPDLAEERYTTFIGFKYPDTDGTDMTKIPDNAYVASKVVNFVQEFWHDADRKVDTDIWGNGGIRNTQYFEAFYTTLRDLSSRRIISYKARIKLTAPDSNKASYLLLDGTKGTFLCKRPALPILSN